MMRAFAAFALFFTIVSSLPASGAGQAETEARLIGRHPLTLQWLDNNNRGNRGEIEITRRDGELRASGYQEEICDGEKNWLRLSGRITVKGPLELELDGTITTRVGYINGGKEHERKGLFRFRARGGRQYWRLQNRRTQPDKGIEVTDYIDIHFRKL